jgi:hypothetical protein
MCRFAYARRESIQTALFGCATLSQNSSLLCTRARLTGKPETERLSSGLPAIHELLVLRRWGRFTGRIRGFTWNARLDSQDRPVIATRL